MNRRMFLLGAASVPMLSATVPMATGGVASPAPVFQMAKGFALVGESPAEAIVPLSRVQEIIENGARPSPSVIAKMQKAYGTR